MKSHSRCKQPRDVVFVHSTAIQSSYFLGKLKGRKASVLFSVNFNYTYSVAVKINISNSACLKQQIQAIPQMLNLADKLKFFCVASFKCYKHFQLDYLIAEIFLTACKMFVYV